MNNREKFVATRPITWPRRQISTRRPCALALARRIHRSCHGLPLAQPLPIASALFLPSLAAVIARAIPLARLPTPPALCRLATHFTAIARLRTPRPEQPFTSLEQTAPGPMMTGLWTLADLPDKMTLVHGSWLLPLFKSRGEASTSLRGVSSNPHLTAFRSLLLYEMRHSRDPALARWPGPLRRFGPLSERC